MPRRIKKSKMEVEHIHLWRDTHPMTSKTYPLTIYFENDNWFKSQEENKTTENRDDTEENPIRNIEPESVVGIVFTTQAPPTLE
jgi:hypothetical protein